MKTAVILFNLGGPDQPASVEPFLRNLFSDPAIISLPTPFRQILAWVIARQRAPIAGDIYRQMGGGSPLLPNTQAQADSLERALGPDYKCFIAMRYWHPRAAETIRAVRAWGPDHTVLLPLYPQYSSTTTGSSFAEWDRLAKRYDLAARTSRICCWPVEDGFCASVVARINAQIPPAETVETSWRLLFSAHGLPKRVIAAGDPYQFQVERSVASVMQKLNRPSLEHAICYQSRVGPLEWIGPSVETEIKRAAQDGKAVLVIPIAFVSEHSETLVELDVEYRHMAEEAGVKDYRRAPTVDVSAEFISGLATLVRVCEGRGVCSSRAAAGDCPAAMTKCPKNMGK